VGKVQAHNAINQPALLSFLINLKMTNTISAIYEKTSTLSFGVLHGMKTKEISVD